MTEVLNYLEEVIKNEMFIEFSAMYFWLGYIFYMAFDIIDSGINHTKYKIKLIKDYERIIAENLHTWDVPFEEEKKLICKATINHKNRLKRKSIFKNLFKKKKEND